MAEEPSSPLKDKNYNLIAVLEASLKYAWQMETYAQDAEKQNDEELARWFRQIQENNQKAGDQGKKLLYARLQQENG